MSNLAKQTEKLYEEVDDVMKRLMGSPSMLESMKHMDDEDLANLKRCFKLMDSAKEYSINMAAQLDKIDVINNKLDSLLAKK